MSSFIETIRYFALYVPTEPSATYKPLVSPLSHDVNPTTTQVFTVVGLAAVFIATLVAVMTYFVSKHRKRSNKNKYSVI